MKGKTVLITGATAGIGRVTARELAAQGAGLILVARNREKAEATREWLGEQTGATTVEILQADLASLAQVRSIAREVVSRGAGLDVLVNNVGAVFQRRTESAD